MKPLYFFILNFVFTQNLFSSVTVDDKAKMVTVVDNNRSFQINLNDIAELSKAANQVSSQEDRVTLFNLIVKNNRPLTPEEILRAGLNLQAEAMSIMSSQATHPCQQLLVVSSPAKAYVDAKPTCVVCSILKNERESQTVVAQTRGIDLLNPRHIELSYSGSNDQPFHGAIDEYVPLGDDVNGHTYGSKFDLKMKYNWGDIGITGGTDLYVTSFDVDVDGRRLHYVTDDEKHKILQLGDEHSYLRVGTKIFLLPHLTSFEDRSSTNPYLRFQVSREIDSDQGIGRIGGVYQREKWHRRFGVREDYYLNQFKDRKETNYRAAAGVESYIPVGSFGLCTEAEAGVTQSSTGRVTADVEGGVSIDTGNKLGGSRQRPIIIVNFKGGVSTPIRKGDAVTAEIDQDYGAIQSTNPQLIGDQRSSYGSAGIEMGSRRIRFGIDAIYEHNDMNDGDILYMTTLKYKFK